MTPPPSPPPLPDPSLLWSLVEEAALGWILLDSQARVVTWNPWMERTSGISKEQILGHPLSERFPTLRHSRLEKAIADALNRGLPGLLSPRLNAPSLPLKNGCGQTLHQTILVKPVEPNGLGRYCFIQIQDVTHAVTRDRRLRESTRDLRRAKSTTETTNRLKSQFLLHMGHALRTPLSTILGMAELLKKADDLHKVRRQARAIHDSGEALRSILDDILDYARIEADAIALETIPFDPTTLLIEVSESIATRARAREIDFLTDIPADLPFRLMGDPRCARQALTHLLHHALSTTPRGEIRLTVRHLKNTHGEARLACVIRDTGTGLDAAGVNRLFTPLDPNDTFTPPLHPDGHPLGPAIALGLVKKMQGTLDVESAPGRGTIFRVELPFSLPSRPQAAPLPPHPETAPPVNPSPFPRGVKILVVEDDEMNREVTHGMLKRLGVMAELAGNGEEALRQLASSRYDLVFMDCQMPTMDGFTASRLFRDEESSRHSHTPIVALTANAMKGDRERCLQAGMDDYLTKPVRGDTLKQTILRWVHW
ncbi:MAG: response regulator [Magnetococcales bacterium]|nr:response regulator [Magnetococcales bacterium]